MERVPVTSPPPNLIIRIKEQKVVPIIGAGLSKSARVAGKSSLPDYHQLLEELLARAEISKSARDVIRIHIDNGKIDNIINSVKRDISVIRT